jgi:hypothetical protein
MAFAAALGKLGATEAIEPLLALLRASSTDDARMEFTLAIARLVGEEHRFIQLQRRADSEPGTTFSQAVTALGGKLARSQYGSPEIKEGMDRAAALLAQDDLAGGVDQLHSALHTLPAERLVGPCGTVVRECMRQMDELGSQRVEYVVLALHAFECGIAG